MSDLKDRLIGELTSLPDITVGKWKDTELVCVFYKGKEVAHFQDDIELDLRLTPKIIKQEGLAPPADSTTHPDRSPNSRWLVQPIREHEDIAKLVRLVHLAAEVR